MAIMKADNVLLEEFDERIQKVLVKKWTLIDKKPANNFKLMFSVT